MNNYFNICADLEKIRQAVVDELNEKNQLQHRISRAIQKLNTLHRKQDMAAIIDAVVDILEGK